MVQLGVPVKKLSMIKRFKEILEGDLTLFEQAVALAPQDFEMNDEKTQLRSTMKEKEEVKKDVHADSADKKNARNQQIILDHFEVQNKRSIYSVSSPPHIYVLLLVISLHTHTDTLLVERVHCRS